MPNMINAISKRSDDMMNQLAEITNQPLLDEAIKYWDHIAPIVKHPRNDKEFNILVSYLDRLLEIVGSDENHHLAGLVDAISNLIAAYEEEHYPAQKTKGIDALKYLMEAHQIKQSDLRKIGSQGVVSEILNGKRSLNLRQIKFLAAFFHVDLSTFIDD